MYEKPSQWLKRVQSSESEANALEAEAATEVEDTEEQALPETRAEYRKELKRMVERVIAAQSHSRPSPEQELGEQSS